MDAVCAAENEKTQANGVPKQAVAEPRPGDHQDADPAGSLPPVDATHDAPVPLVDETPDVSGYGHASTSAGAAAGAGNSRGPLAAAATPACSLQRRAKSI